MADTREVQDTSDYKLDKQGKKIKAHRIVFSKGEDDGKGEVTENMKKSFSSFIEQHAALLEAKCSECGEEKHDGDCEMQESRSHSIIATKLKQIDARKTRDADALKRHNEMLSSIATSDASPEHKKAAIDALNKKGVTEAKADPLGSWISHKEFTNPKIFKTREGAKAHAAKTGGTVNSSEGYHKLKKEQIKEDKNMQNQQRLKDALARHSDKLAAANNSGDNIASQVHQKYINKIKNKMKEEVESVDEEEYEQIDELSVHKMLRYTDASNKNREVLNKKWDTGTATEREKNKVLSHEKGADRASTRIKAKTGKYPNEISKLSRMKYAITKEDIEQMDEKHLVNVTMSDPNHTMVSKRKETMQRRASVTAKDREHAIDTAIKHYQKQGYKVHDHQYVGMKEEALKGNQHKLDKNKNGKLDQHDFKLLRKEDHIEEAKDANGKQLPNAKNDKTFLYYNSTTKGHNVIVRKDGSRNDVYNTETNTVEPYDKKKHGRMIESLEIEESNQNVAAHVKTNKYSWGTMKTVHQGSSFSIPLHPEHHEAIAKLKDQQEHKFKDETGHHWTAKRQGDDVHFQGANGGNSTKVPHKAIAESKEDVPFDGPYKSVFKKPNNPNRTGMDAARALAQRAAEKAKKEKMKEEKKTFKDFLNNLNEIKMSDLPKRTVKGNSYGAQYHDPEGDDDADADKKKPQPNTTEKRGRGRPAGSKSGANFGAASKNKSGVEYTGYKLHLPNSNR